MNELPFHQVVLALFGIAGLLEFGSSVYEIHWLSWSARRRIIIALCLGPNFLYQTLFAFQRLSDASSLELFGFFGCLLGLFASVRMLVMSTRSSRRTA